MTEYNNLLAKVKHRLKLRWYDRQNEQRVTQLARQVARLAKPQPTLRPVLFFNASTRLTGISLNAAFSSLSAWGLRLAGVPVVHFVCQAGMSRCVLGSDMDDHLAQPPCQACIAQSRILYSSASTRWFSKTAYPELELALSGLGLEELRRFSYHGEPLGDLVLPSLRWRLRRHHLQDTDITRYLYREFISSAYNVSQKFEVLLDDIHPSAVVVFNGQMFPEAIARRIAQARGIPVITHEVSFQPFSAFFTSGQATAYPIDIPADFELNQAQNTRLDAYLEQRFQGRFSMAGIEFWPEIHALDQELLHKISQHKQMVPIFTNVIFDTSQPHANTIFRHMFAWLNLLFDLIKDTPDTLFVIRAHPDEHRPGSRKQARQSVSDWVRQNQVDQLPNVVFINSQDYISSYDLVRRAKFICVYNSSIALEAAMMGAVVLCGGSSRFTGYNTMHFPGTAPAYRILAEKFLSAEKIDNPPEFQRNARRFYYYQTFRTAIPFADFLENHPTRGYVRLKIFPARALLPQNSLAIGTIYDGIMHGEPFLIPDEVAV